MQKTQYPHLNGSARHLLIPILIWAIAVLSALLTPTFAWADAPVALTGQATLTDAFCTKSSYVFSKDEQAFIDAIHHIGSTWTDDVLVMGKATAPFQGTWTTTFTMDGMACTEAQDFSIIQKDNGHALITFGPGRAETTEPGHNPNRSITCEPAHEATEEHDRIEIADDHFDLIDKSGDDCGDFHLRFLRK